MSAFTFDAALQQVSAIAHARLPDTLHSRLEMATALVAHGAVWVEEDSLHASVRSRSQEGLWHSVNGACDCEDAHFQAPQHLCAHRLAVGLYRRAAEVLREPPVPATAVVEEAPTGIDPRFVVTIQDRPYVRYAGLLSLAHARGLQELRVDWTFNDAEISLAHAVAVFPFGTFEESGDSSKANVGKKVALHWRRMSLTRAAARVLRNALAVDACSLEELAGHEEGGEA